MKDNATLCAYGLHSNIAYGGRHGLHWHGLHWNFVYHYSADDSFSEIMWGKHNNIIVCVREIEFSRT
jgi:hypothetical protein